MSRDNARTPMQWDSSEHGGFTTGRPWMAVNPNTATINAAAELADPDSVFHHYRRLIELRHTDPVVAGGDFRLLLAEDPHLFVYTRTLRGDTLLVAANCSPTERHVALADPARWARAEVVLCSGVARVSPALSLGPWSCVVCRTGRGTRA